MRSTGDPSLSTPSRGEGGDCQNGIEGLYKYLYGCIVMLVCNVRIVIHVVETESGTSTSGIEEGYEDEIQLDV